MENPLYTYKSIVKLRMTRHYMPMLMICTAFMDGDSLWRKESGQASFGAIVARIVRLIRNETALLIGKSTDSALLPEAGHSGSMDDPPKLIAEIENAVTAFGEAVESADCKALDIVGTMQLVEETSSQLGKLIDLAQRRSGLQFRFAENGFDERSFRRLVKEESTDPLIGSARSSRV
ncbi:hypothetical protein [Paenibacillus sp. NPDC058071]|uniref:hypothetical protein n=1 Tax=Paenibacillus sp. NPDC058071 TaxID=3346326 RepID=UPI0036DA5568